MFRTRGTRGVVGARGKARYLERLTSNSSLNFKSIDVGESMEGSSPPSIFIGRFGYPKVSIGPMLSLEQESGMFDTPESWLDAVKSNLEIVNFRLQLVRGKRIAGIREENSFIEKIRDIALAKSSIRTEAEFKKKPRGTFFHQELSPFGPSGELKSIETENRKYHPLLEKAFYDSDLKAADVINQLNKKGLLFSQIQKALSVGAFGLKRNRKLVPTRWSITATDSTLSEAALNQVKDYSPIETFRVHEFSAISNHFSILMMPAAWQYELIESFIRVLGNEEVMFSDYESHFKKKGYATIGGCYYSARLAVAEHLQKQKKQASTIVFREAYPGYIPLGVWDVRESVRKALQQKPAEFSTLKESLSHINKKLYLPMYKYINQSQVLRNYRTQRTLKNYF